jgi:hypothetical protein
VARFHCSPESAGQAVHDGKPESGPDLPDTAVALVEHGSLEGHRKIGVGESRTTVAYLGDDRAGRGADREHDRGARRRDPQRVLQ